MNHPISYAMRNAEATRALVYFNAPSALKDWSFLAVEGMILAGFGLACAHAYRQLKATGSRSAVYTLVACLLYGLWMDILSYYTVENFWHGEFSVMLLYNRLPLYIALFYPAFLYHVYMTIRRYDLPPLVEAASAGFFAGLGYMIFDNLGPMLGWWVWDRRSPTNWPLVDNVPVTSYHWMFLFTGAFAFWVRRLCFRAVADGKSATRIHAGLFFLPVLTIATGALLFEGYNAFGRLGARALSPVYHAVVYFAAGVVFLFTYRRPAAPRDRLLLFFPLLFVAGHAYIFIAKFKQFVALSVTPDPAPDALAAGNGFVVVLAIVGFTAFSLLSHPTGEG